MTAAYGIRVTMTDAFATALERTRAALARQGFGVLSEIDVAATMKAKLDLDLPPHLILGACNPPLAHQALTVEPSISLLLPCNVVLRSVDDQHTLVEALDPSVMVAVTERPELGPVAEEARRRLTAALAELASTDVPA